MQGQSGLTTTVSACPTLSQLLSSGNVMAQSAESCMTFPSKEQKALCGRAGSWTCLSRRPDHHILAVPGCFAWTAVVLSGLEHNNLQTVLAAKPPCPERLFVPSSTEEQSLHYKYIKHMNSSDKEAE